MDVMDTVPGKLIYGGIFFLLFTG